MHVVFNSIQSLHLILYIMFQVTVFTSSEKYQTHDNDKKVEFTNLHFNPFVV